MEEVCEVMKANPLETYAIKSRETLLDNKLMAVNESGTVQCAPVTVSVSCARLARAGWVPPPGHP